MENKALKTVPATLADLKRPAAEERLFAILDCCDAPELYAKVQELGEDRAICLYRGELDPEVAAEAPYLVRADPDLVDWLYANVWKTPWGIFAISEANPRVLRKHFRRFLIVQDDAGDAVYFSYYDPRVLSVFLPTCTEDELQTFLGPVLAYSVADPQKGGATHFFRTAPGHTAAPTSNSDAPPLRMRPEQMEAFSATFWRNFEDRALDDLKKSYPAEYKILGEAGTRAIIRKGIERAGTYGISAEHDVFLYIKVMFMLGENFDRDQRIAWAETILKDQPEDPTSKTERLFETAERYLQDGQGRERTAG